MLSLFPVHAAADSPFVRELCAFLEAGCDVTCWESEGLIEAPVDILDKAEEGLAADILLFVLSPDSSPRPWARQRWEPLLNERAREIGARAGFVLLADCPFPELLRRGAFFDAKRDRLAAMRQLKRWIVSRRREEISADLNEVYKAVGDRPGDTTIGGAAAERFVREAGADFEGAFWIPAYRRTVTQVAGELGSQLGMRLEGPVEENCRAIRSLLERRRCLVIFDGAERRVVAELMPQGRTSYLFTREYVRDLYNPRDFADAREFVRTGRLAEAYELLNQLFDDGVEREACARELVWICEKWDRLEEAAEFRVFAGEMQALQLSLF